MEYSIRFKIISSSIFVVLLLAAGYFYYSQKSIIEPVALKPAPAPVSTASIEKKSLTDDPKYIEEKINGFLADNPKATAEYAQDIIYHDIAVEEKDTKVCDKIKDNYWKDHCYKLLK